ncbi:MAG: hypothetical protein GY934_24320, partial [Gammaproteobacteria bacterium]|nr:hypothetical protein [Gammaproteobacteria bacterium]
IALSSFGAASVGYLLLASIINRLFAADLAMGQRICQLPPVYLAVAALGGSGGVDQDVGGDLKYDNGECEVTATIGPDGSLHYDAVSTGTSASNEQCKSGAGIGS